MHGHFNSVCNSVDRNRLRIRSHVGFRHNLKGFDARGRERGGGNFPHFSGKPGFRKKESNLSSLTRHGN